MDFEEEVDTCRSCGEDLLVEHLLMSECGDILCTGCMEHHAPCDICWSEHESDSDYVPEEVSSESASESTESSEAEDPSGDSCAEEDE